MVRKIDVNHSAKFDVVVTYPAPETNPNLSYAWYIDNINQNNSTTTLTTPIYTVIGEYHTVKCTVTNTCVDATTSSKDIIETLNIIDPNAPILIIQNGTFDTSTEGWLLDTSAGSGTLTQSNYEGVITVSSGLVQLSQTNILLEPNKTYKLKFNLYASTTGMNAERYLHDINVTDATFPTGHYIIGNLNIDLNNIPTIKQLYEYQFTTGTTVPSNVKLRIKFTSIGTYKIDNISIESTDTCPDPVCNFVMTVV